MKEVLLTVAENLSDEVARLRRLLDRLPLYLDDIASLVASGQTDMGDEEAALAFSHLKERLTELLDKGKRKDETPLTNTLLSGFTPILSAEIARLLIEKTSITSYLPVYDNAPTRVAYFRNAYSDQAYRRFAKELSEPTVSYYESFAAVCEELYAERCELAILPVSSSRDGRLFSMEKLMMKYDLAPTLLSTVPTSDGETLTFALLANAPTVFEGADRLALVLYDDCEEALSRLLSAACHLNCRLSACKVLTESHTSGFAHAWQLELVAKTPKDLLALWLLLLFEYPHHLLSGIFKQLD